RCTAGRGRPRRRRGAPPPAAERRPGTPPSRRASCASSNWRLRVASARTSLAALPPAVRVSACVHQRLDPGELSPLHQLERGAAAGGEPIDPVGEPEGGERGGGVAAPDHGGA